MFLFCRTKLNPINMAACRNDIPTSAIELINCVQKDDIFGAKSLFFNITEKEDMKSIVAKRNDCNAPLFEAVVRENVEMVRFLVKECLRRLRRTGSAYQCKWTGDAVIICLLHSEHSDG